MIPAWRPRVSHVVAGIEQIDGGPAYSVPRLCSALGGGADITLLSVARDPHDVRDTSGPGYRDRAFEWDWRDLPVMRGLRASSALAEAVREQARRDDILHGHGLWLMPNLYSGWTARAATKPLIVTPRGMLSDVALSFSPWKKRIFWSALQGPALRDIACFHATSEQEHDEIRAFGLTAPVAVIPNGIDMPAAPVGPSSARRTVLSLGRIHPKKGLDNLLFAWSQIEPRHPGWRLRIVGPAEKGHDAQLRALSARLGLVHVSIEPGVQGAAKDALFQEAGLFVLPTRNENFALTVAEALSQNVPVISTKGAPWRRLDAEDCGWWIDHGVEPLAAALEMALALPDENRDRMGIAGRAWMAREFSWPGVAHKMLGVYAWLAGKAPAPALVRFQNRTQSRT